MRIRAVPAVSRALAILRLLAKRGEPVPLRDIAERLDIVPSTALHILRVLVAEQIVRLDGATKRYSLGVGLLPLARAAVEQSAFPEVVRPHLDALSSTHKVTAIATEVPNLHQMIVVAMASAPGPVRLNVDIGTRFPSLIHATGRCVAAFSENRREEIEAGFKQLRWDKGPDLEEWWRQVDKTRKDEFNIDAKSYFDGLTLVATPVLDSRGFITHAVAAAGISSELGARAATALAQDMLAASRAVAKELAGHP